MKLQSERLALITKELSSVDGIFSSPGRAEILGNHTDHQGGKVIVSTINCDILCAVQKRTDDIVEIRSMGFTPVSFRIGDPLLEIEKGKSIAMVKGVILELINRGYTLGGFTACTDSTVFRGAGVSSSAAFELLIVEICNDLFLSGKLTPAEKAAIAQKAESEYFGKPCGLLDQSGISYGGFNLIDFKGGLAVENLTPPSGYALVLTNTGGSHSSLTEHYASIREEMCAVANCFGKKRLADVPYFSFLDGIGRMRKRVSERAILRAIHFFDENRRVEIASSALKKGNVPLFLEQVRQSGKSSVSLLQNAYVSGSDQQPILLGMAVSEKIIKKGAVRLHGGGFAGTILAFVKEEEVHDYVRQMSRIFGEKNVFVASTRKEGTCRIG